MATQPTNVRFRNQHPLDSMIDKLIDCRSAAEVGTLLASESPGTV
jgi:hypothetical protein